tara:strand:+ start:42712 stop:43275 length:564 start_codon:yes stop_codon:yes gene_type:complete
MRRLLLYLSFLFISVAAYSQTSIGIETRAYPAGIVPGIHFDLGITEHLNLNSQVGYNFTDRRDWGKHDSENGGGFGFGLGLERSGFLTERLSVILRTDLWFMDIDWRDTEFICPFVPPCGNIDFTGSSEITVLHPTFGFAYLIPITDRVYLKPSFTFGYEINIKTEGEDVGEGAILLVGFQFGRYLK